MNPIGDEVKAISPRVNAGSRRMNASHGHNPAISHRMNPIPGWDSSHRATLG